MHFTRGFGGRDRVRTCDPLLAKQVLSQLSYTPTVEATLILKHFRAYRNPFLRILVMTVPKLFQNPMFLCSRGLLRARSRFPKIVENTENVDEGMERLDGAVELAKQVLSQLSYTPTVAC